VQNLLAVVLAALTLVAQTPGPAPTVLPATASIRLMESFKAASAFRDHVWRDTSSLAGNLINGYIEIPMGELTKYEFDMGTNTRKVDRVMPDSLGGYPVNYGYVPQTVSFDGDPFDVLVLGPALPGGELVKGVIVGLMLMEDEKGLDSKVVISPVDENGKAKYALTPEDQARIGEYFNAYKAKDDDPKTWSKVPGWGTAEDGLTYVLTTAAFFQQCRVHTDRPCSVVL
jgi:inorganic pyrophosphatase